MSIISAVPQGSFLRPVLFLVCVNDLPHLSTLTKFVAYTYDTIYLLCTSSLDTCTSSIHKTHNIRRLLRNNKLTINYTEKNFIATTALERTSRRRPQPSNLNIFLIWLLIPFPANNCVAYADDLHLLQLAQI